MIVTGFDSDAGVCAVEFVCAETSLDTDPPTLVVVARAATTSSCSLPSAVDSPDVDAALSLPVATPVSALWFVVEDPLVVVGAGSATSGLLVVSDDSDEPDCVAAEVSSLGEPADDVALVESDASVLPDDTLVLSLSDTPVLGFESDDDEPEPVELPPPADDPPDADSPPLSLLDDAPEPESSACATPVPPASATPKVTAPTPSHLYGSRLSGSARWAPPTRRPGVDDLRCLFDACLPATNSPWICCRARV
jgi:hypothetical protein